MSESGELERNRPESIASLLSYVRGGREKGSASRDASEVVGNQTNHHTPEEVDRVVGGDRGARSGGGVGVVKRHSLTPFESYWVHALTEAALARGERMPITVELPANASSPTMMEIKAERRAARKALRKASGRPTNADARE